MQETLAASKTIRAIKAKQTQLRQQGLPTVKAGKAAAQAITGKSTANTKKKVKQKDRPEGSNSNNTRSTVYSGGKKSAKFKPPSKSKQDKKKLKLGGKGSKSFKSKKKYKR